MANGAIFIGFGRAARARERQSLALLDEARNFYADLEQRGEIEAFESVLLEPHGGDLAGFFLLKGSDEQLDRVRRSDTFRGITSRATLLAENVGVVAAHVGDGFVGEVERYRSHVEEQLASS